MKKIDKWNDIKKQIDKKDKILKFRQRDIFFVSSGQDCEDILPQKTLDVKSHILFDLDMPKWVLFFYPIMKRLDKLNIQYKVTSRSGDGYTELNDVLELYQIPYISIGEYGGASLESKLKASIDRQIQLIEIVKKYKVDKIISGSVVDITRVAFGLGIAVYNFYDIPLSDYKTNFNKALPQARLTIPLTTKMFKPFVVPDEVILRFGLEEEQIIEYNFIDPLLWIKDFKYDEKYVNNIYDKYNIDKNKKTIIIREEEYKASYVAKKYPFLYEALSTIKENFDVNIIIIPRYESDYLKQEFPFAIILEEKIFIQHLLKKADIFIGGGGTINTEACFLGTPTISTRSFICHYDKWQIDQGMMVWVNDKESLLNHISYFLNNNIEINLDKINQIDVNTELNNIVSSILE